MQESLRQSPRSPSSSVPPQRWHIAEADTQKAQWLAEQTNIDPVLAQVLLNRGIDTLEAATEFLHPENMVLPDPREVFPDLPVSLALLQQAIAQEWSVVICGDYDADGMTSTALLLRSLRWLGANVNYDIPSRMSEGYGINERIVEDCYKNGIRLILTVDNGIAAYDPIARAKELGIQVIITDHHDLPPELPPADAILNPKLLPTSSVYWGIAGVGVAYILAVSLAKGYQQEEQLDNDLLALFALGTVADLAPLTGVNRKWVRTGLRSLPHSPVEGIKALIQVSGVTQKKQTLKPEDIGFRLGPRINAVGRIADPQTVIELLTTDDPAVALQRATECEQINRERQSMCHAIEQEAIEWVETQGTDWQQRRVLVLVQPKWHHGVIGIVASRLVERYGVPVFIATYEDEQHQHIRGSARGIPEFHVFEALQFCDDLLGKYGGHRAAGGFSLAADNFAAFRDRLSQFAHQCLQPEHLKPLISIDARLSLAAADLPLYEQMQAFQPMGIENNTPIFWTSVEVIDQKVVGDNHVKLRCSEGDTLRDAIAWRWGSYYPLPRQIDVAYRLQENEFNGIISAQLEIAGVRLPAVTSHPTTKRTTRQITFTYKQRQYSCAVYQNGSKQELRIRNQQGEVLAVTKGEIWGLLGKNRDSARQVDVRQPFFYHLIKTAIASLPPHAE